MAPAGPQGRRAKGPRRRREDDEEEEGGPDALEVDDDSMSDASSDEHDPADDSDTSDVDEASPTLPTPHKSLGNGAAKHGYRRPADVVAGKAPAATVETVIADADTMLNQLSISEDKEHQGEELNFDDIKSAPSVKEDSAPIIVSSVLNQAPKSPVVEQKRREHEEYRRKRDEDPTFVPNRGGFFLHDHRGAGPAANGFRPFTQRNRGGRGGRGGAFGGQFAPISRQFDNPADPTMRGPWQHDMHDEVIQPPAVVHRPSRYIPLHEGPPNGNGIIPHAPAPKGPINRSMSTEKPFGTTNIRVFIPSLMKEPKLFQGIVLKNYTKLPDHRPPLRRDKPVRISLPDHGPPLMPRYIYPAQDRSFIFIPRSLRPNQQRTRGRGPRSVLGSGGFSRRTSVWGGSVIGSMYSPSIAMSRRSSIAPSVGREFMLSPTGSAYSRPPLPHDASKPVVRLPPFMQPPVQPNTAENGFPASESSLNTLPQPHTYPLPQKPAFQETTPSSLPMHQPRPQKTVSVENIESPVRQSANAASPYQHAFHHQVPPHVSGGLGPESHARHPSYNSQYSSATPLSQIPERAIHAAPFQPNTFGQPPPNYYPQTYPVMPPQQGYYYPQGYPNTIAPNASAPAFIPAGPPQGGPVNYAASAQGDAQSGQPAGQTSSQNLVTQELNGTVYYFNASELPAVSGFPAYPAPQQYTPGMVGMTSVMPPGPDQFYYSQPTPGMVYFPQ
ncbi:CASC3/Barentsz eIF4AIII binding-domain-containing protein [Podospora australis]|uniref:CASC3/Barentsz eIF4AIII binding-domain-containing protein n=1 Tax=Podospora australis TaxID=1536484 RepID=A0AAN6X1D2_9PEZI|nr:CASC3/Barentsz eIF4AIII binding-domain-containing protein [Podospora australis]